MLGGSKKRALCFIKSQDIMQLIRLEVWLKITLGSFNISQTYQDLDLFDSANESTRHKTSFFSNLNVISSAALAFLRTLSFTALI